MSDDLRILAEAVRTHNRALAAHYTARRLPHLAADPDDWFSARDLRVEMTDGMVDEEAEFAAAASPKAVLSLLDERDAARAQVAALQDALRRIATEGSTRDAEADRGHLQGIAREALALVEDA